MRVDVGVHLPQIGWDDAPFDPDRLTAVAVAAERLGFTTITANDHLAYGRPWLDGPIALAAISAAAPSVQLMTSVSLPVVRGPFALAKALAALDVLSGGRVEAGLGPGSSAADYALGRHPVRGALAPLRRGDPGGPRAVGSDRRAGRRAVLRHDRRDPLPSPGAAEGPPIWVGSWGSAAGMRRVARLADGWLASGYNTTPETFTTKLRALGEVLQAEGRDPRPSPRRWRRPGCA